MYNTNKLLRRTIITIVVLLVLAVPLLYSFVWRPTDSDYTAAANQLHNIGSARLTIIVATGSIQNAPFITSSFVTGLEKTVNQYDSDVESLSKNVAFTRDFATKAVYDKNKSTILDFGRSADNLVLSLKKYIAILDTCSVLVNKFHTLTSTSAFDAASKDCNSAIDAAKSAPYAAFNNQFLASYTTLASNLVGEYRKVIMAADAKNPRISLSGITGVIQKITTLRQAKLSLSPTPEPSTALQKLTDVINTQKTAFWR